MDELAQRLLLLPSHHEAERAEALRTLNEADARWWLGFDESLRSHWSWALYSHWPVVARVARGGDVDALDVLLAGCHADGRIREAVLARLAALGGPAAMTVLAIRTGDWVPQVRIRARREVDALLSKAGEPALSPLAAAAIATRKRVNGSWLAERIDEHVMGLTAERLEPLLRIGDSRTRRIAYRTAIERHRLDADHLVVAATKDQDQRIRVMAARAAVAGARSLATLHRLAGSRTALVRAEALTALAAWGESAAIVGALADRHPVVREVAQAAVRAVGGDPAEHYRRLVTSTAPPVTAQAGSSEAGGFVEVGTAPPVAGFGAAGGSAQMDTARPSSAVAGLGVAGGSTEMDTAGVVAGFGVAGGSAQMDTERPAGVVAGFGAAGGSAEMATAPPAGVLAGLGETGDRADAPALRVHLSHPSARGRVAALRGLRRLGCLTTEDAVALLTDPSSAVVKNAVAALRPDAATLDADLPDRLLEPGQPRHTRFAGYRLAVARGPWARLIVDLRLLDDSDEQLSHVARVDIDGWLSRAATLYRMPTGQQRAELTVLLDRASPTLRTAGVLRFHAGLT
ncbi:hypothetical protein Ais01nite_03330 [Asanoa ishikariensis]|nr:hypothetical protein [Asanoa ishikariensis]GIF62298.1 hypothetical protein Ais01nite_03330 [Asanoa ishikariensis]